MPVTAGIRQYSRNVYNTYITSNLFVNFPFGQVMLKYNADRNKMGRDIGIPEVSQVISGNMGLGESRLMSLATAEGYRQDFDLTSQDDTIVVGERATEPIYANSTTNTPDLQTGTAEWRRMEIITPIKVWKSSVNAARATAGADSGQAGRAVLDVFGTAIKKQMAVHVSNLAARVYNGIPNNQDASKWTNLSGVYSVCSASNTYARLNRLKSANLQWRGNRDATARAASLKGLTDYARYSLTLGNGQVGGLQALGRQDALKVCFAASSVFQQFKNEAEAKGNQIINAQTTEYGHFGITGDAVQYGNTMAFCDQNVTSGYALFVNPADFTIAFEKGKQYTLSPWVDLQDTGLGKDQAYEASISSSVFFICHNPLNQVLFTGVATS